jgi:RimJ/RimL family protein N-acetyltransferase
MIPEEGFLDFKCPYCGELVSFPSDNAGFAVSCPMCVESLIVPADGSEVGLALPFPLSTPRLVLRRLTTGDWKDLLELYSDEELFRYQEGGPMEEEQVLRWLESDSHVKLTTLGQPFFLGIEFRDGGKLIGYLRLYFTDAHRLQAQLDILLSRGQQRKGLGTEALAVMLDFCFEGISLHRVAASCDCRNVAACRVCGKVGMRREGVFQKNQFVNGEWRDTAYYAILAEEYRATVANQPERPSA